jgi:hypothetical protein
MLLKNHLTEAFKPLETLRLFLLTFDIHPFSRYLLFSWKPSLTYELLSRLEALILAKQQVLGDTGVNDPEFHHKYPVVLDNLIGMYAMRAGLNIPDSSNLSTDFRAHYGVSDAAKSCGLNMST